MKNTNGRISFVNRIKLAEKQNDSWLNSHKWVVMQVRMHISLIFFIISSSKTTPILISF